MKKQCSVKKTYIGGQAVLEGVMMRGKQSMAIAVRDENHEINIESYRLTPPEKKSKFVKLPIIRGVVSFVDSLVTGTKVLMRSASVFGEEETSKFDDWVSKKTKKSSTDVAVFFGAALGLVFSILLFFLLPQFLTDQLCKFTSLTSDSIWYYLIEGLVRIIIFLGYIMLTALLKDIKRTYQYHGAEHKTIACFESGKELTVENVRGCTRIHDRCGTSFLFIVMIISILIFAALNFLLKKIGVLNSESFSGFVGKLLRFGIKLLCLPIVAGVSYEVLKLLAKTKSSFFLIFKAPGMALQKITTREPDDDMIEVAIASFKTVYEMDNDETIPERKFSINGNVKILLEKVQKKLKDNGIEELSDGEWIICHVLGMKRSEISTSTRLVTTEEVDKIFNIVDQRITGKPLWYIIGDTDFYGYTIKVNENVLIPRPETEELVSLIIKENQNKLVLDVCTGSGAIAIALANNGFTLSALDISEKALQLAEENATLNNVNVNFFKSDMFENVMGKYDIIVSNPPYVKRDEIDKLQKEISFEPRIAFDGGEDGYDFYRILAQKCKNYLTDNGKVYLECGEGQSNKIIELFKEFNDNVICEVVKDLNGVDRIVKVIYD